VNEHGLKTLGSCCGHEKYRRTIIVQVDGHIEEYFSGKIIHREKRFYRKDSKGYYFIPEVKECVSVSDIGGRR
jgi:hypothetical protein